MRRRLLLASAVSSLPTMALARVRPGQQSALRLGADTALANSGFATALLRGFGGYAGLAIELVPGPTSILLEALDRGEMDAALTVAPQPEERLEKLGLIHDRRHVAQTDFVLVGPKDRSPEAPGAADDVAKALARIAGQGLPFVGCNDGSGAHWCEQALWRAAAAAPVAPWYRSTAAANAVALAREQRAHVLLHRAAWMAGQKSLQSAGLALLFERDPRQVVPVHVMRSFRVNHPTGKLFVAWAAGPQGRRLAAKQPGFSAA